jgi:hypothetical protein
LPRSNTPATIECSLSTGSIAAFDVDRVPIAELPALIAELAALQTLAAMRLRRAADEHQGDDVDCLDVEAVSRLLKCSVDLVRERGFDWGIAKVLARDKAGRPSRVVYPKALLRAYLNGEPDSGTTPQRRAAR